MIKLFDDWVVLVDDYNYTLAQDKGQSVDKNGKVRNNYKIHGYYGSLRSALSALADKLSTDTLKEGVRTLDEAVRTISECHERVERLLEEVKA